MKRRKRRGHFWQQWSEERQSMDEQTSGVGPDFRSAWHQHFAEFLGTDPEKHWLFGGRRFKPWVSGSWGPPGLFNPFVAILFSKGGGLLSLYVLHLLAEKPRYGNDIMKEIEERTQGRWGANPGAVYPLLTDLEKGNLVESTWEDPDKRTRRIYSLMPSGHKELERLKEVMRPKLEEAISILRGLSTDLDIHPEE